MIQVLLRNILSKSEAEREAKQLKGKVLADDLNSGKYKIVKLVESTCEYHYLSGAGSHCKLKRDTSGYHTWYRTECFANQDSPFCLLKKKREDK